MSGVRLSDVKLWTADQKIAQRFPGLRNQFSASLFALLTGVSAMSQAQSSLEDLQKRKAIAEAEKAMIDAEFARDEAKKKLTDSQVPIDPAKTAKDAKVDAAKSAKEIADAEKAEADAKLAALKAKIGEVPASGISGNVTLNQGAASFETALLAARAAITASKKIAEAVASAMPTAPDPKLLIFAAGEVPDFQATTGFFAQRAIVLQALVDAVSFSEEVMKPEVAAKKEFVAAAGVALDAVAKLLGFFKSEFAIQGIDLTADHSLLAKAVAAELLVTLKDRKPILYLKGTFNPTAVTIVRNTFMEEIKSLTFQRGKAAAELVVQERKSSDLQTQISKIGDSPADKEKKRQLGEQQKRHQEAVDKLKSALAAYDTFVSKLASPDANVAAMIRELEVWNTLNGNSSLVLIVKMDRTGGSSYVQKNLWTTFGKMPFKVMGGAIASYTLFQGTTGAVLASGLVPVHGGFSNANEVGNLFQ